MRCLGAQCEAGQLLVDVFVNYDCDLEGANLYERLVLALVRLAQGTADKDASLPAAAAQEEQAIRLSVRTMHTTSHWIVPRKAVWTICNEERLAS